MQGAGADAERMRPDPRVCAPLLAMHAGCLLAFATGASPATLGLAALLSVARLFGITAGYHRYFAHRAFRTGRGFQLVLALLGASTAQLGPLWWAGHHRRHHRHADTPRDLHSPARGLFWAHLGWLLCDRYSATDLDAVPDLARYPELRLLDRWPLLVPVGFALAVFALGELLAGQAPQLGTDGPQLLAWAFFVGTVVLYHVTFVVNSLGHRFGARPFATPDRSGNLAWLALPTLGDAWHNNHHRFPGSARHGLRPGEWDPTWWLLRGLAACGLVWNLRQPSPAARSGLRSARNAATASAPATVKASPTRP